MDWLNYHHLLYFWHVARLGSIVKASEELGVSQPTISGQLKELEQFFGERLFDRVGRRLQLTEVGQLVFSYADDIFPLGRELVETVKRSPAGRPPRLVVGATQGLPKLVTRALMEPALRARPAPHVVVREAPLESLLELLGNYQIDIVFSDAPAPTSLRFDAFNHNLGDSTVSFFCSSGLAKKLCGKFPRNLHDAPMLLPTPNTTLRRAIDTWLQSQQIVPEIAGEFEDSSLLKTFGQVGQHVFPSVSVISEEITRQYDVVQLGTVDALRERFYAISCERKVKNPAAVSIVQHARREIFV